ncbi:MAG: phosphate transport system permease protein [Frankiales bacterium]|jgi:phosphate transport system permease protein|nr:phosphate transport system permease protein [Frankiales bacterium]
MTSLTDVRVRGMTPLAELRPATGRRVADAFAKVFVTACFVAAVIPLVLVLYFVISKGAKHVNGNFLTHSMARIAPNEAGGGAYHAIIGTLEQVGLASLISVPLGLLVAVYIAEYGRGALRTTIRFFVDVMTGIPSIVAGLFIYAFWVLGLHKGFSGFAGAMALAVLMLPIVVRSSEEMLLLVPGALREASYALGIPRWKTVLRVVLPTASAGITTGVMLAVARVTGETAPLILTVFDNNFINTDAFHEPQSALSLFVYNQSKSAYGASIDRAWAGAFTLITIVIVLYVGARFITRRNALTR